MVESIASRRLGKYLLEARGRQAALAKVLNVTESTVSGWRTGRNAPNTRYRQALLRELGIAIDDWDMIQRGKP